MVAHANRQLEKMTDRYLLVRDNEQPLELMVVDGYQAGEIRSTKNLSGGQSCMVWLNVVDDYQAGEVRSTKNLSGGKKSHGLIGSADGKKYHNFAQGLTFELMVAHANRQLEKMTDRYLLVRDNEQPLDLNVVDDYQAGVIRSTKNLSGGESFIVSLTLALGLSKMASPKVRVDSLLLDEGFGTLDEGSLEIALEPLSRLQQDGKLIGIISHVPASEGKDQHTDNHNAFSGGRSSLAGPGCSKVANSE